MKIKRILVPTDFSSCSNAALDQAVLLALAHRAELVVLHVVELHAIDPVGPEPAYPDVEEIHRRLEAIAGDEMGRLIAQRSAESLALKDVMRRGVAAAPTIVAYAEQAHADLIVMGTHGRRGLRRLLLGSVTEEVVSTAGCPVLTVHPGKDQPAGAPAAGISDVSRAERIVVPHDFSADADAALGVAQELARQYGSRIDVIHVIAPPIDPEMYTPLHDPARAASQVAVRQEVTRRLNERIEAKMLPGITIEAHVCDGHAASGIVDFAHDQQANLIVIASHGLSGLRRFLLGSVTASVVRSARCPVLMLRAPNSDQGDEA